MCIPTSPTLYRAKVAKLAEALNEPETNRDAAEAIRALIGEVVLTPGEKRGEVHASLRGELMAILETAGKGGKPPNPVVRTNVAACPRNQLIHINQPDNAAIGRQFLFRSPNITVAL
jgi:hypothetical protein